MAEKEISKDKKKVLFKCFAEKGFQKINRKPKERETSV